MSDTYKPPSQIGIIPNLETPDPENTEMGLAPYVNPDGRPVVALVIRKDSSALQEVTLNGRPAWMIGLNEQGDGTENAPWALGSLLAENWEKAKKMAEAQKAKK